MSLCFGSDRHVIFQQWHIVLSILSVGFWGFILPGWTVYVGGNIGRSLDLWSVAPQIVCVQGRQHLISIHLSVGWFLTRILVPALLSAWAVFSDFRSIKIWMLLRCSMNLRRQYWILGKCSHNLYFFPCSLVLFLEVMEFRPWPLFYHLPSWLFVGFITKNKHLKRCSNLSLTLFMYGMLWELFFLTVCGSSNSYFWEVGKQTAKFNFADYLQTLIQTLLHRSFMYLALSVNAVHFP